MKHNNLGPHSVMSPEEPHPSHSVWLKSFSAQERHELIAEDQEARSRTFAILISALLFGLCLLLLTLLFIV